MLEPEATRAKMATRVGVGPVYPGRKVYPGRGRLPGSGYYPAASLRSKTLFPFPFLPLRLFVSDAPKRPVLLPQESIFAEVVLVGPARLALTRLTQQRRVRSVSDGPSRTDATDAAAARSCRQR